MHDLGTLGGHQSYAVAVNASGQVAGMSETPDRRWHPFFWSDGVMTDLGTMGGYYTWLYQHCLNDAGQVLGGGTDVAERNRAFIWHKGVKRDLGAINDTMDTSPRGINAAGVVLGSGANGAGASDRAFVVTPGACTTR